MRTETILEPSPDERRDRRIERLSQELAAEIDRGSPDRRIQLRDYATHPLREGTDESDARGARAAEKPLGLLGLAFLMVGVGGLLLVVLPPVGIVLLLGAGMVTVWGSVRALLGTDPA